MWHDFFVCLASVLLRIQFFSSSSVAYSKIVLVIKCEKPLLIFSSYN